MRHQSEQSHPSFTQQEGRAIEDRASKADFLGEWLGMQYPGAPQHGKLVAALAADVLRLLREDRSTCGFPRRVRPGSRGWWRGCEPPWESKLASLM